MTTAVNTLKEKVQSLPALVRSALERQAKARIAVARLEARIAKYRTENPPLPETGAGASYDPILDEDITIIKQETMVSRLNLQVTEAEDKAELAFRAKEYKVTEGHVKAAVGSDPDVIRLRRESLEAKEAFRISKATVLREKQLARIEEQVKLFESRRGVVSQDAKLMELQEKLQEAGEELEMAEVEVLVANATLETYQMLMKMKAE